MTNLPVPAARWTAIDLRRETAVARQLRRNLRRLLVTAAADHLERAAAALRQAPDIDALVLAGHKTTEVLGVLRRCADQLDTRPLPPTAVAAVPSCAAGHSCSRNLSDRSQHNRLKRSSQRECES